MSQGREKSYYRIIGVMLSIVFFSALVCGLLAFGLFDICEHTDLLPERIIERDLAFTPLFEDCFCCLLLSTDPLAKKEVLSDQDLWGKYAQISGYPTFRSAVAYLHSSEREIEIRVHPLSVMGAFTAALNNGTQIVTKSYAPYCYPLVGVPLKNTRFMLGLAHKKELSAPVQNYIDTAKALYGQK